MLIVVHRLISGITCVMLHLSSELVCELVCLSLNWCVHAHLRGAFTKGNTLLERLLIRSGKKGICFTFIELATFRTKNFNYIYKNCQRVM